MPVMSQGWPADSRLRIWNVASGDSHARNCSPQPQYSATSLKMAKSDSASPGAAATFLMVPMRRSELMKVPSFSPHAAAGSTRSAICAVSVDAYMSWTTRKSRRPRTSRTCDWLIHECAVFVATTQSPLMRSSRMPLTISW